MPPTTMTNSTAALHDYFSDEFVRAATADEAAVLSRYADDDDDDDDDRFVVIVEGRICYVAAK